MSRWNRRVQNRIIHFSFPCRNPFLSFYPFKLRLLFFFIIGYNFPSNASTYQHNHNEHCSPYILLSHLTHNCLNSLYNIPELFLFRCRRHGNLTYLFYCYSKLCCRLIPVFLLLGCSLGYNFSNLFLWHLLQRHFVMQLHFQNFMSGPLKWYMSHNKLKQHYPNGINICRFILVHHIANNQFRRSVCCFSHKLSGGSQLLVLCSQCRKLFSNTIINNLYFPIRGNHNITRIKVTMDISFVVQSHNPRQYIFDNKQRKATTIRHILIIQLLCKRNIHSIIVCRFSF